MRFNIFGGSKSRIVSALALSAGLCGGRAEGTTTITFAPQTGPTDSPFVSDTESGFTVTPTTANNWFQALLYGNPTPDIYDGPIGSPSVASIQVTDGGSLFGFISLDYSSNNGATNFVITGTDGGTPEFSESGQFANGGSGSFNTYFSTVGDSTIGIDTLNVTLTPLEGTSSVNLDNIVLSSVPEPASVSIMLGLAAMGFQRRRRNAR